MECPFKSMDFYDFDMFQIEAECKIEQVKSLIDFIKPEYQCDIELYPALEALNTLLNGLKEYIEQKSKVYDLFKEDFDKNRALAKDCSQAKALRVDRVKSI